MCIKYYTKLWANFGCLGNTVVVDLQVHLRCYEGGALVHWVTGHSQKVTLYSSIEGMSDWS